ncbi:uncharacterized protein LOC119673487 [Teleopsis dalmanni]|uniref:uncharacterized protein LOC119673487 n=1 Tax=Teleopsis dalmanni TaxID=139649 RepID=UPI0018CD64E9|nr:uncharacterized protein LOC119673487 [Teleopsis dalmanni]XP_037940703.1 uncharacterized protein LOC119673487 [Teleopsis dalmanni]XP_037940704.1 uncharacterized protein LOC119673487 [Teleopsis dalmanni]XP_037940705.1 uncharacterized protein LOC119673487 [Teleopsis dalmanni]
MTEVDAVMPEGVSVPIISQSNNITISDSEADVSIDNVKQLKESRALEAKETNNESMEVDAPDTEEDDSQITSSSENGCGSDHEKRLDSRFDINAAPADTLDNNDKTVDSCSRDDSQSNDVTQNSESQNEKLDEDQDSVPSQAQTSSNIDSNCEANSNKSESTPNTIAFKNIDSLINESTISINEETATEDSTSSGKQNDNESLTLATTAEIVKDSKTEKPNTASQQENGALITFNKVDNITNFVDLGDDSDVEMDEVSKKADETIKNNSFDQKLPNAVSDSTLNTSDSKQLQNDSDGAVIINSDSETEALPADKKIEAQKPTATEIVDDDDDDCVVIEDDTPAPINNEVAKRKNEIMDLSSSDDLPPNKRQRVTPQPQNTCQIAIKDPRSLMAPDLTGKKVSDIYPVNITPATATPVPASPQGPPKLVPMTNPTNFPFTGLPGLNTTANCLPGLTDDMFVLEAPSFIVPYIYEKPPADQLKEVVKLIETKYEITKDDLADVDKSDEFDMMTEQNKEDRVEKSDKKKKKKHVNDDGDDSWTEESDADEDEEDDDDSETGVKTKVLIKEVQDDFSAVSSAIKPAAAVVATQSPSANSSSKPGQENYFESPLGKFFMDIGVGLVQEFVQADLLRLQKRKMRKSLGKNITEFERAINALSANLEASKKKNVAFKFTMKRCEFCTFKSESALAMANHYETPHMNGVLYKCNFCPYEIRNATEIVYHMEAIHNIKARLIKPLPYHQCPNCGFEDNGRAKLARHQPVCAKKFRPEINLLPPVDWEAPAKIPRIKPRHGLVGTATAYQAMAAQAAAQKAALATMQQQQAARNLQAAAIAAQNAAKVRQRAPPLPKPIQTNNVANLRGPTMVRNPISTNVVLPNNYQFAGGQLVQSPAGKKPTAGQPSISITPLPRQTATPQPSAAPVMKMPPVGMKPGQNPAGGNKAQFVICEICDGYIKDLEQLRNHMQWMHKVKIHPKMIYNRPPLNCQKCQFRFFTDQGLERHLLGSHGLVTSSMQEAANKGKDAGRCPVCGRMYQWKLLNHVSRDHHMTLKPAHLSYKCTVCTATFGMYKLFETHVYTAHSTVAKKAMDNKKNNSSPGAASSSNSQRNSFGSANDSLLKPLKINDEITIIPQPASKSRINNMESHIID